MAADPISAGIGVLSTTASIIQKNKERKYKEAQEANQAYAARVRYKTDELQLTQQRDFSRMQSELQAQQLQQADSVARLQLSEQNLQATQENANRSSANDLAYQQALERDSTTKANLTEQGYQQDIQQLGRLNQGYQEAQANQQASLNRTDQVSQALDQGNRQQAQLAAIAASNGQAGSRTSQLQSSDTTSFVNALEERARQGRATEDDLQQLNYLMETNQLQGNINVTNNRYANSTLDNNLTRDSDQYNLNRSNLGYASQYNDLGARTATSALDAARSINQQRLAIDDGYRDASYDQQVFSGRVNAGAATPVRQPGTGLLDAASLGGSLFSLYKATGR